MHSTVAWSVHQAASDVQVGLRPGRSDGVRIEREDVSIAGKVTPVIHNYGHGGSGFTLFWGCVQDAMDLAASALP